jgi:phytoene dehydrogenase-like protein
VLLDVALLRLRRPIHEKPNISLPFAALVTKPGEKTELENFWDEPSTDALYRTVVERLAEYAQGIGDAIVGHQVLTPLDLETTYGVSSGHLFHGEHATDQLAVRPTPECAGYRTPFDGLFLCGSGSHPGGGITCAPGALAARTILGS